jgi:hypothetical protein
MEDRTPPVEGDSLSLRLQEILDEADRLLALKSAWGRMPAGSVKSAALEAIDAWFAGNSARDLGRDQVSVAFESIREIWQGCTDPIGCLAKVLDRDTIRRLQGNPASQKSEVPNFKKS